MQVRAPARPVELIVSAVGPRETRGGRNPKCIQVNFCKHFYFGVHHIEMLVKLCGHSSVSVCCDVYPLPWTFRGFRGNFRDAVAIWRTALCLFCRSRDACPNIALPKCTRSSDVLRDFQTLLLFSLLLFTMVADPAPQRPLNGWWCVPFTRQPVFQKDP